MSTPQPDPDGHRTTIDVGISAQEAGALTGVEIGEINGNVSIANFVHYSRDRGYDPTPWLVLYLRIIYSRWQSLPLERIVTDASGRGSGVKLPALFTPLDAWAISSQSGQSYLGPGPDRGREPAIAALGRHRHGVLVGDPGSGKSTLVRFLAVCNAGGLLQATVNLDFLNRSVLEEDLTGSGAPIVPWRHEPCLPIYVELRQLASEASEQAGWFPRPNEQGDCTHLLRFLRHRLANDEALGQDVYETLIAKLNQDEGAGVLVVLDGLDEVDEAGERRMRLKQVVEAVARTFQQTRIVITGRTYAYQANSAWRLADDFRVTELAPYSMPQMTYYVRRWYEEAAKYRPVTFPGNWATEWSGDLVRRIRDDRHVRDLAERPLLLAMMTLLHDQGNGRLPAGGRAGLYDETVKLLTDRWINAHGGPPLTDGLGLRLEQIRAALEGLAFRVHADQPDPQPQSAADVPLGVLCEELEKTRRQGDPPGVDPGEVRRRLYYRAGILTADDENVYRFPHRSFQEYLAACALARSAGRLSMPPAAGAPPGSSGQWEFPHNVAALMRTDPHRWREVTIMAGGWAAMTRRLEAWALANLLSRGDPPTEPDSAMWWSALAAGQVLLEHDIVADADSDGQERVVEQIRSWLAGLLTIGALTPIERATAGRVLSELGDPRPGVGSEETTGLPAIAWVPIRGGAFRMRRRRMIGTERYDEITTTQWDQVSDYRISRYPITYAQFEPFVAGDGYTNQEYWTGQGWAWLQDRVAPEYWHDAQVHLANHPVVGVSWYEADAFCRWMSRAVGHETRLPTEIEWDYAARGADERMWPWGDAFDALRCNMAGTGVGRTCAVGMFPMPDGPWGKTGPLDMMGNVWEWCVTKWRGHKSTPEDNKREGTDPRIIRGGSYSDYGGEVHSAFRWGDPPSRSARLGFRVVAPT